MTADEIQNILYIIYPEVQDKLKKSIHSKGGPQLPLPPIELHKDIYARLSDIPGSTGEESHSSKAQYDDEENKIFIYYPNMRDEEHVVESLIHEYTHYLQNITPLKRKYHAAKYTYDTDPHEQEAHDNEKKYKNYFLDLLNR